MILLSKSVHAQAGAQIAIHVTMSLSAYQPHWLKWTTRSMSHFPNDDECLYKALTFEPPPGLPPPPWEQDPAAKAGCWVPWSGMSPGLRSPSLECTDLEQMDLAEERIALKNESAAEADVSSGGNGQRDSRRRRVLVPNARRLILQWLAPTDEDVKKILDAEKKAATEAIQSSAGKRNEKGSAA